MLYIESYELTEGIVSENNTYGTLIMEYSGVIYDNPLTFGDILKTYSKHDLYQLINVTYDYFLGRYTNPVIGAISTEIVDEFITKISSELTYHKNLIFELEVNNSKIGKVTLGYYTHMSLQALEDCSKLKILLMHQN